MFNKILAENKNSMIDANSLRRHIIKSPTTSWISRLTHKKLLLHINVLNTLSRAIGQISDIKEVQ